MCDIIGFGYNLNHQKKNLASCHINLYFCGNQTGNKLKFRNGEIATII